MVGVDKKKLSDLFKKKDDKKEAVKKAVAGASVKKPTVKRAPVKKSTAGSDAAIKAFKDKKAASKVDKTAEVMHSKTHQDLINAAYKAAEELKIAPWVLLRAAEWGHFTDDRGKKYDGPVIDDLKGLDDAQKAALKKAVGL
jgi:hypothetical protein